MSVFWERLSGVAVPFLLLVVLFGYHLFVLPRSRKHDRLQRIYGFISALALSCDATGLYFDEVFSMVRAERRRLDRLKAAPPIGTDPFFCSNDYEFALRIVVAYARRNDLPRLEDYASGFLPAASTLDYYHSSAPFDP